MLDEAITRDVVIGGLNGEADLIVNVVDATNLRLGCA
jgi:Fe2+ transport system protein B